VIAPDWPAPARVRALLTTRDFGDLADENVRRKLRHLLPSDPQWLKQVHGKRVIDLDSSSEREADASFTREVHTVCVVKAADCMPVLFTDVNGTTVAVAHAGWRGLAGGVLEETVRAMAVPPQNILAWMGPAIGPRVYEIGAEVHEAFSAYPAALRANRPGHWLLDLYAVAREQLKGLRSVTGGGYCTYTESNRFFSYRRDRSSARMAALVWLTP
jgi:YfiH family protein